MTFPMIKAILLFSATTMMAATPIAAQAQTQERQAVASSSGPISASIAQRVSAKSKDKNRLGSEVSNSIPIIAGGAAALIAIVILAANGDDKPTSP